MQECQICERNTCDEVFEETLITHDHTPLETRRAREHLDALDEFRRDQPQSQWPGRKGLRDRSPPHPTNSVRRLEGGPAFREPPLVPDWRAPISIAPRNSPRRRYGM